MTSLTDTHITSIPHLIRYYSFLTDHGRLKGQGRYNHWYVYNLKFEYVPK